MSLKTRLYLLGTFLHLFFLIFILYFYQELENLLIFIELVWGLSLLTYYWLVRKGLEPLEYADTFSNLLKEEEFTVRFSKSQPKDLDKLTQQFNQMLERLHQERLKIGERHRVFELLMAESPIGVLLLDFEQKISQLNPAAEYLLSIESERVVGLHLKNFSNEKLVSLRNVEPDAQRLLSTDDGHQLKVSHHRFLDRGFQRSFFTLQEMTTDIAQSQKLAYDKLIRLMSHEVNNTIAITNSLLESCLNFKTQLDSDSRTDYDNAINIVIERCQSLNEFMQVYANVVQLPKPVISRFNLTNLLRNLAILFYSQAEKLNVKIHFEEQRNFVINADVHLIEQALVNIIKNAIESVESQGNVWIMLDKDQNRIELSIRDDGQGLTDESRRQLFTPFFTTKSSGQGVGLMLVNEIFGAHNYSYSLKNNEGNGAIFSVSIPIDTNDENDRYKRG